ncbi:MFS transporter [Pelagibius litoralis]|uniref:MFS transporter n=2 Tax=Pelagibius litoralis TaxID=374515 RepID=A0A967C2S4_9PROT|nr:MFS transporter [Pelagibius litoralis]
MESATAVARTQECAIAPTEAAGTQWTAVYLLTAAMGLCGLGLGFSYPLFSLVMERQGADDFTIGLSGAMTGFGLLASNLVLPALLARFGPLRLLAGGIVCASACLALAPYSDAQSHWYLLRFGLGCFMNIAFIVTEVWLNGASAEAQRGRIVGFFTAVMAAGFALGPLLILLLGSEGPLPFLACAGLVLLGALTVLPLGGRDRGGSVNAFDGLSLRAVLGFFRLAPLLAILVLVYSLFDGTALVILPIYFVEGGFTAEQASAALACLLIGMVILQPVIGWLLDRFARRRVMAFCTLVSALCCLALPAALDTTWLLGALLLLLGGLAVGLYTGALTLLGEGYSGESLVAGTTCLAVVYGLGSALGPLAGGGALHRLGPDSVPYLLAALFAATTLFCLRRPRGK